MRWQARPAKRPSSIRRLAGPCSPAELRNAASDVADTDRYPPPSLAENHNRAARRVVASDARRMTSWQSLLDCAQSDVTLDRIKNLIATTGTEPPTADFQAEHSQDRRARRRDGQCSRRTDPGLYHRSGPRDSRRACPTPSACSLAQLTDDDRQADATGLDQDNP